jgi:hypothetical protein
MFARLAPVAGLGDCPPAMLRQRAQPTQVRTLHLPLPEKTAPGQAGQQDLDHGQELAVASARGVERGP